MDSKILELKPKSETPVYPCLMRWKQSNCVVFMASRGRGVVVVAGANERLGNYNPDWDMSGFQVFRGTIQITN